MVARAPTSWNSMGSRGVSAKVTIPLARMSFGASMPITFWNRPSESGAGADQLNVSKRGAASVLRFRLAGAGA
jgi:hypothetical protein